MPETSLKIKVFGAHELRRKAKTVKQVTDLHGDILSEMAQLMYDGEGIGLAAPQVGIRNNEPCLCSSGSNSDINCFWNCS